MNPSAKQEEVSLVRTFLLTLVFVAFIAGCTSATRTSQYPAPFLDGVDIAVNLGLKHAQDLLKLENAMALEGMRCRQRAMSLNAFQLLVERTNFDQAKALATRIIIRDGLTVRLYESPDFAMSPASSQLEVWEKGRKIREEHYKLY